MCRPLLSITAWHLLLHKWINVLHSSMDIFSDSPFKLIHSSSMFLEFFSLALSFSNFQTFWIGFMSGLWAGRSITVTSSSERNVLIDFAMWYRVLSCCFFNIPLYTVVLILPCSQIRSPVPVAEIMPNTITLHLPNLMLLLVHWGEYRFLGLHLMNLL